MDSIQRFYDALANDDAMRERANALNEKHKDGKPDENAVKREMIAFAKAEGFDFTAEALDAYAKQAKPLADDELEAVAGGVYSRKSCFCAMGGGGKDPETGKKCACVIGGYGPVDKAGNWLNCAWAGSIWGQNA